MAEVTAASGAERLAAAFSRPDRIAALMPYMMGGFPSLQESLRIGQAYVDAGADVIELGVPYSDPLADGPVIHEAATAALAAGASLGGVLEIARALSPQIPVVLMCYANMVFAPGVDAFVQRLAQTGACGMIVPDLPLEEATPVREACAAQGIALVPLVAPTSSPERMSEVGAHAEGFLYTVSVMGTTGERPALCGRGEAQASSARGDGAASSAGGAESTHSAGGDESPSSAGGDGLAPAACADGLAPSDPFREIIARAKRSTGVPVAIGFGIGSPEQARQAAEAGADGVIVGSRLVRAAAESERPAEAAGAVVAELAAALAADR